MFVSWPRALLFEKPRAPAAPGCIKHPSAASVYETRVFTSIQGPLECSTPNGSQCVLSDAKCAVLSCYLIFKHGSNRSLCMYRVAFILTLLCVLPSLTETSGWVEWAIISTLLRLLEVLWKEEDWWLPTSGWDHFNNSKYSPAQYKNALNFIRFDYECHLFRSKW